MKNLQPILIFLTVAEMGSFTRAADSLGIQKGRASMAVRKLEEDVGVRLLHRTTRSVQLTEDGRAFHARARELLAEVDDLQSMFAGDRVALRGRLRVDLPTEVARITIVPALPDFMATHPELELEVSSTDRQVDLVQEGFDCVLRLGPVRDETLIARPLGLLRMVLVLLRMYLPAPAFLIPANYVVNYSVNYNDPNDTLIIGGNHFVVDGFDITLKYTHVAGSCKHNSNRRAHRHDFSRPRTLHMGDDDPRLRRHRLHGLSSEAERNAASPGLITISRFELKSRLRAVFCFARLRPPLPGLVLFGHAQAVVTCPVLGMSGAQSDACRLTQRGCSDEMARNE